MSSQAFFWVFSSPRGHFPGGIFLTVKKAEAWIAQHGLAGVLTRYPLDMGSFDWALSRGWVPASKRDGSDADFIGSFWSTNYEHFHYEAGVRA